MKLRKSPICLFLILAGASILAPQAALVAQSFSMSAVAGFNAGQIDGDDLAGFDKIGLTAGLRARWETPSPIDMNIEFLYSQRGSRPDVFNPDYDPDINVNLQYAEIPVYVTLSDWWQPEGEYHKASVHAGFSYGRLIQARTEDYANTGDSDLDNLVGYFSQNDISWLAGAGIRFSPHWGMTVRYTRSIPPLLDARKHNLATNNLVGYFLSFRLEYTFN